MSEYQYYEFLALDRPLTDKQRAELRSISTRAEITATRFVNEYEWGDLKGDPQKMVERYFDAFLYLANWGTRRLMFRLPRRMLDAETAKQYCHTDTASIIETDSHLILRLYLDRDPDDYWTSRAASSRPWSRPVPSSPRETCGCCTWPGCWPFSPVRWTTRTPSRRSRPAWGT